MRLRRLFSSHPGYREKPKTSSLCRGHVAHSDESDEQTCSPCQTAFSRSCVAGDSRRRLWQNLSKVVPLLVLGSHGVICGSGGVRGGGGTGTTGRGAFFFFERRHFFFLVGVSAGVVSIFSMEHAAASTARGEIASTRESEDCAAAVVADTTAASFFSAMKPECVGPRRGHVRIVTSSRPQL